MRSIDPLFPFPNILVSIYTSGYDARGTLTIADFTARYGLSKNSSIIGFAAAASRLNLAPGNHAGIYFTGYKRYPMTRTK